MLQIRTPKFDARVSALALKLKFIQFAVLVSNTISVLDSLWGKYNLVLFEHIKGHSSNKDKASINKLRSLWTHPHLSVELSLTCREAVGVKRRKTLQKVLSLLIQSHSLLQDPAEYEVCPYTLLVINKNSPDLHSTTTHTQTFTASLERLPRCLSTQQGFKIGWSWLCGVVFTTPPWSRDRSLALHSQGSERIVTTALAEHGLNLVY